MEVDPNGEVGSFRFKEFAGAVVEWDDTDTVQNEVEWFQLS